MLWTWDLTRTLGWQSLAPPAQQRLGSGSDAVLDTATTGGAAGYRVATSDSGVSAGVSWAQPGDGMGCWLSAASLPEEVRRIAMAFLQHLASKLQILGRRMPIHTAK